MNEYRRRFKSTLRSGSWKSMGFPITAMVLAASVFQTGCATYSLDKAECLGANWEGIGYADGAAGYSAERLGEHNAACARHGVNADSVAYDRGRERGLTAYCTDSRGFEAGRSGSTYRGVCPNHLEGDFLNAYELGRSVHRVEQGIETAEKGIWTANQEIRTAREWSPQQELEERLAEVDRERSLQREKLSRDITRKDRKLGELREELRESEPDTDTTGIKNQIRSLEREIQDLETDRRYLPNDYERRRSDVRVDHERSRERLIANNNAKLEDAIRRKDELEGRKAELEIELSGLLRTRNTGSY